MSIEPPSLNIPLEQNEPWVRVLLFAWILGVGISALLSVDFAIVFAAAGMVVLPIFWLFFFPPHFIAAFIEKGCLGKFGIYGFIFIYLSLAERFLIPLVAEMLGQTVRRLG
jgi:hypothetical protein